METREIIVRENIAICLQYNRRLTPKESGFINGLNGRESKISTEEFNELHCIMDRVRFSFKRSPRLTKAEEKKRLEED